MTASVRPPNLSAAQYDPPSNAALVATADYLPTKLPPRWTRPRGPLARLIARLTRDTRPWNRRLEVPQSTWQGTDCHGAQR